MMDVDVDVHVHVHASAIGIRPFSCCCPVHRIMRVSVKLSII